ncbi:integrase core domain-containing protein [Bradyrhizobium zhanjiangense]|uniref:integrase core domain-containing protein n=1 Tax=Bradyrhizobium zhanjiangense TaxID=1325107 RepID=UPI003B848153
MRPPLLPGRSQDRSVPQSCRSWRRYYNEERPHDAIGNRATILLQNHVGASSPPT